MEYTIIFGIYKVVDLVKVNNMKIDIITIFPNQILEYIKEGIFRISKEKNLVDIHVHNLRDWTDDVHRSVDDKPFGGGAGMVMKIEPIYKAIQKLKKENTKVIYFSPRGKVLNQKYLENFDKSKSSHYIIICGHYEGIDQRIIDNYVDIELSIGDYVLSGGELPTLVFLDGVIRLIDGVLGNESSSKDESFSNSLLEYPQYTRPEEFMGMKVPEVLLSGHHKNIEQWRKEKSIEITKKNRPDILK